MMAFAARRTANEAASGSPDGIGHGGSAKPSANHSIYRWESSTSFNASADLEKISATMLAIHAADDERNPPETGRIARDIARIRSAKLLLIPASTETRGHLTTGAASFYKPDSGSFDHETT